MILILLLSVFFLAVLANESSDLHQATTHRKLPNYDGKGRHRPPLYSKRRWCHRDWPTTEGVWSDEAPFWTSSPSCPNRAFDEKATVDCLKGRTVYTMGNSIGRQALYGILEMLGGASVKREDQRDMCPKHETTWDDSCHNEFAGVKLRYLFMQYMNGFNYNKGVAHRKDLSGGFPYFDLNKIKTELSKLPEYVNATYHPIIHYKSNRRTSLENNTLYQRYIHNYPYKANVGRVWDPIQQQYADTPSYFNKIIPGKAFISSFWMPCFLYFVMVMILNLMTLLFPSSFYCYSSYIYSLHTRQSS
jgi:hypothetical protein